jgi:hypothetical protein
MLVAVAVVVHTDLVAQETEALLEPVVAGLALVLTTPQ